MSDPNPTLPAPPETPATGSSRGVKIALALSLAVNLAVAGLAAGAWLRDGPHRGIPRDMSFGPFSEALNEADRRAIRRALMDRMGEFRTQREAARAEFEALLTAMRAENFDPAVLKAALSAIETRMTERLDLGRTLIEARLFEMTAKERAAFADRLEKGLRRDGKD